MSDQEKPKVITKTHVNAPPCRNRHEYRTADLYYAAYLQTAGVEMLRNERDSSTGRVYFFFDTTSVDMDSLRNGWVGKTSKIVAMDYANNLKTLKGVCHNS